MNEPVDVPFETLLEQLEETVRKLEDGQLGLGAALGHYERGIQILRKCYAGLEQAERRVELLSGVDAEGNPITRPFEDQELSVEQKAAARTRRRTKAAPEPTDEGDVDSGPRLF